MIISTFSDLKIRTKILSLVVFLVLLAAGTSGYSIQLIDDIGSSISDITEVSSPLVRQTSDLVRDMDRVSSVLLEGLG